MNIRPYGVEISVSEWDRLINKVIVRHTQIALKCAKQDDISILLVCRGILLIKSYSDDIRTYRLYQRLIDYLSSTKRVIAWQRVN